MGCLFCHNPESWDLNGGEEVDGGGLLRRLERFRPFLRKPGLTISGGEPLFQPEFTLELISRAKASGWHVAVDTSGWGPPATFRRVSEAADLMIFSVKHPVDPEKLAPGADPKGIIHNLKTLAGLKKPVWLRYVLIPGWSDSIESLKEIGAMAREMPALERVELLPFNNLAGEKWLKLNRTCPILEAGPLKVSEEQIVRGEQIIGWRQPEARAE